MEERGAYFCCDMKSFYASVECVARGLDPLTARLLVADDSRTDKTIVLAVSPALKAIGVPSRPRLFEAKQAIALYEAAHRTKVDYITATPRMAEYIRVSAKIYEVFRRYVAEEDIHVYSIDECFVDAGPYLRIWSREAERTGVPAVRCFVMSIIRDVLAATGITATVGIGTNLYLAKVGMDLVAKKAPPDENGVRIAELDEESYRLKLWTHRPLTDFWMIGHGTAERLKARGMRTMGDIAAMSLANEAYLYKLFGINAELLIDHAWGIEPTRMSDIKNYRTDSHSLSTGQVLPRPYKYDEGFLVFREMADLLCADLAAKRLTTPSVTWRIVYDPKSLEENPEYRGEVGVDFYGRLLPKSAHATVRLRSRTNSASVIMEGLEKSFADHVDPTLLIRRLMICANQTQGEDLGLQMDMFTDVQRENDLQRALVGIRRRYGMNAVVKGMNLEEGATTIERNTQIGGHRAGSALPDGEKI
ncbi:MAG: DNA methylase [Ruminococcaceae bacterium]|jgi:DNA polymerase V|nr:DNA methylase [Oscillospiraceae bacterium]